MLSRLLWRKTNAPCKIKTTTNITQLSPTVAINNTRVYQLQSTSSNQLAWQNLPSLNGHEIVQASAGLNHHLILIKHPSQPPLLASWGSNDYGQCGPVNESVLNLSILDDEDEVVSVPTVLDSRQYFVSSTHGDNGKTIIEQLSSGYWHNLVLTAAATTTAASNTNVNTKTNANTNANTTANITIKNTKSTASNDKTVYSWGAGVLGTTGVGGGEVYDAKPLPVERLQMLHSSYRVSRILAAAHYSLALCVNNNANFSAQVFAWGYLPVANTGSTSLPVRKLSSPTPISGGPNSIESIHVGHNRFAVRMAEGRLDIYGNNFVQDGSLRNSITCPIYIDEDNGRRPYNSSVPIEPEYQLKISDDFGPSELFLFPDCLVGRYRESNDEDGSHGLFTIDYKSGGLMVKLPYQNVDSVAAGQTNLYWSDLEGRVFSARYSDLLTVRQLPAVPDASRIRLLAACGGDDDLLIQSIG